MIKGDTAKDKKLTLKTDVFLWMDGIHGLLYDSSRHESFKFPLGNAVSGLCAGFLDPDNLYSVFVEIYMKDEEAVRFINEVVRRGFGFLHCADDVPYKVSFPPLLNLQRSWERLKSRGESAYNEILLYLTSVTVYTGGDSPDNGYCTQTVYPVRSGSMLPPERILDFLRRADSMYISEIRIVFSSADEYPGIQKLLAGLEHFKPKVSLYFRACDPGVAAIVPLIPDGFRTVLLHEGNLHADAAYQTGKPFGHMFLVSSEDECAAGERFCGRFGIADSEFIPVFNGYNRDFFKSNVFLTEKEILRSRLSRREIFAHQALNTYSFGKLSLLPDGKVYAAVGREAIGDMDDTPYSLIVSEMDKNTAWRRTRDMSEGCRTCIYRYLCPSPSPYEEAMETVCICADKAKGGSHDTA